MNICIGGTWHGSKLLENSSNKKSFTVKDKTTGIVLTYFIKEIMSRNCSYVFWVSDNISEIQANEFIAKYINQDI